MIRNNESISFEDFKKVLYSEPRKNKHLREGQLLMAYLCDYWKEEYKRITGTKIDCFYVDKIVPNTIAHLKSVWNKRDLEIANREDFSFDRRRNKVFLEMNSEMTLTEFAGFITKSTKLDDLPQLIALIVKIVDNEQLSVPLINHFEHLKNRHYSTSPNINKPFNLLNYEGY